VKSYSTYYEKQDYFNTFIKSCGIVDNDKILIQIFSSIVDEKELSLLVKEISTLLPTASIIGATTDGEICSGKVTTKKTVISLTQFEKTRLKSIMIHNCNNDYDTGREMATQLAGESTNLIITFTDGLNCNGEEYLKGISSIDDNITIAGGMAGDNATFSTTYVISDNKISSNAAVGIAFINPTLLVHTDHSFNWLSIGKEMTITNVDKNRVYTIDNISAYEVYEKYLGKEVAINLPAIGVEFPLIIKNKKRAIARAVLAKHDDGSLSFAGDIYLGDRVTFGYGDVEMILNHSIDTQNNIYGKAIESIFIYSCMARRRFMPDLIEDEIKPLQRIAETAGFFTYGEFFSFDHKNELLNQTMTLVGISESDQTINSIANLDIDEAVWSEYQKSIKAFTHFLNVTTKELAIDNKILIKR